MRSVKLAVADGDSVSLRRYVEDLGARKNIDIVASAVDGAEFIHVLRRVHADVVLTGLALKSVDGFGVLEAIAAMTVRPKALVCSEMNRRFVIDMATRLGADYYLVKPIQSELLYRRICQLAENGIEDELEKRRDNLERMVARRLYALGIPASRKGYQCLMTAAVLCLTDRRYVNHLSTLLYPEVARRLGTTPGSVEHAIRIAVHAAWENGGFVRYAAETGDTSILERVPTAGQVLKRMLLGK